ncbi:globin [Ectothiorhodospiraceae bacterium WFHF3C12]|nr:globin [Ectothiorhodospiraceae bacterium WFHF3C12]
MQDEFNDVQRSYGRCLQSNNFIARFYDILMDSHPSMRPMFARTDLGRQRRALRRGITSAILYAGGSDLVSGTIREMAQVHSRAGRAPVKPELYRYWMNSLVQAVNEADPQASPALEKRWRKALTPVIDTFVEHY